MIKHLAIWYLKKIKAQVMINIRFLEKTTITGVVNSNFEIHYCDGDRLTIEPKNKEANK